MANLLFYEAQLWSEGSRLIAGVDEVGRGCLAGPVVAAAVILPDVQILLDKLSEVNDSKKLSEKQRKKLFPLIQEIAVDYGVGIVSHNVIDQINILQASFLAMRRALANLKKVDYVLVDGNKKIPRVKKQTSIIKGDAKSLSIASASILAKVVRDEIMVTLDNIYPEFSFAKHKGYPTKLHRERISEQGISIIHRKSFCQKFL